MIVHTPELKRESGQVHVSARVEVNSPSSAIPEKLWYTLPERFESAISLRGDSFAVAMLPFAMALGEDIHLQGTLSSRLLYGIGEYQKIFNIWWPELLSIIDVSATEVRPYSLTQGPGKRACNFSGGLDSGYTLWSHLPQNQPDPNYQVDYGILYQGFDLSLEDESGFQDCVHTYQQLLNQIGVELLPLRTNVLGLRKLLRNRSIAQGSALNSIGLLLDPLLDKFIIPASVSYYVGKPWGTHPLVDHLLSTESLEVIHHGADLTRFEKFRALSDWGEFLSIIRVCFDNAEGMQNCGRCHKCLRGVAAMELLGKRDAWKNISPTIGRRDVRRLRVSHPAHKYDVQMMAYYASEIGRKDLALDLRYALFRSELESALERTLGDRLYHFGKKVKNLPRGLFGRGKA